MMHTTRVLPALIAAVALVSSCGDDEAGPAASTATTEATPTTTTAAPITTITPTTTTEIGELEQPAIWPAADVVFETPDQAAADFVVQVLGVEPALGAFQQGDSRSGEIEVFSPGEDGDGLHVKRGVLLLRQLGADNGWFILAAVNDNASIASPESGAVVAAGEITVEGAARGFEANVVVSAYVAGDSTALLDSEITMGGAMETAEPYSVVLDLSGAPPGEIVMLLVRGGVGLETDPGEFGAIPILVAG